MPENPTWSTPECPFVIEYAPRALDDIRLAVSDAFFSLPRGGAEIGGILLGKWEDGRLTISSYAALDCEHAFGPSFTLSERDRSKLAGLIASVAGDESTVGWYHSHTRSEIFLSDADRDIHTEFFKEPWQVALVMKPHTFLPARAGFFFREADGTIHSEASYRELILEPLMPQPVPAGAPGIPGISPASEVVVDALPAPSEPPPVAVREPIPTPASEIPEPVRKPEEVPTQELPTFSERRPPASRLWLKVAIPILLGAAIGAPAYWKRDLWVPRVMGVTRTAPPPAPPVGLGLNTLDLDGQLQIRWNRNSPAVLQAAGGVLSVSGSGAPAQDLALDKAHLLSGAFTIARQSERVDVALTLTQRDGQPVREATSFLGKLPERKQVQAKEDPAAQRQREDQAKQMAKMKSDLDGEIQRNRKLQRSVDFITKQLKDQQRARLQNQAPDKK